MRTSNPFNEINVERVDEASLKQERFVINWSKGKVLSLDFHQVVSARINLSRQSRSKKIDHVSFPVVLLALQIHLAYT